MVEKSPVEATVREIRITSDDDRRRAIRITQAHVEDGDGSRRIFRTR